MANDGRVRLIKALKVSYWKQFEHGMLSREAVQALINLADTAMDEEERYNWIKSYDSQLSLDDLWYKSETSLKRIPKANPAVLE